MVLNLEKFFNKKSFKFKFNNLHRASDRVRKKFGNYAALLSLIMRQERSIMRQIMRFHFS